MVEGRRSIWVRGMIGVRHPELVRNLPWSSFALMDYFAADLSFALWRALGCRMPVPGDGCLQKITIESNWGNRNTTVL